MLHIPRNHPTSTKLSLALASRPFSLALDDIKIHRCYLFFCSQRGIKATGHVNCGLERFLHQQVINKIAITALSLVGSTAVTI